MSKILTTREFCARASDLVGLSYKTCDCIGVVCRAAGIRCAGTNWLWRSISNSSKYRYLKTRSETMDNLPTTNRDGILVFRIKWDQIPDNYSDRPNCHHVGIIYGDMVIQSNPVPGVTLTNFEKMSWDGWGLLKQVDYSVTEPDPDDNPGKIEFPSMEDMIKDIWLETVYYKNKKGLD